MNAQLIDAYSDAHLWAQTFDRELKGPGLQLSCGGRLDEKERIAREVEGIGPLQHLSWYQLRFVALSQGRFQKAEEPSENDKKRGQNLRKIDERVAGKSPFGNIAGILRGRVTLFGRNASCKLGARKISLFPP